jgi:hypothetical protein
MTDAEMEVMRRWQESPPAKVFDAVRNLGKAIEELRELQLYREGFIGLREHNAALIEHREELNQLIWASRPHSQAAE